MDIIKLVKTWANCCNSPMLLTMLLCSDIASLLAIKIVFTSHCLTGFASDNHRDPLDSRFTETGTISDTSTKHMYIIMSRLASDAVDSQIHS